MVALVVLVALVVVALGFSTSLFEALLDSFLGGVLP
jgi:hypothetical protein